MAILTGIRNLKLPFYKSGSTRECSQKINLTLSTCLIFFHIQKAKVRFKDAVRHWGGPKLRGLYWIMKMRICSWCIIDTLITIPHPSALTRHTHIHMWRHWRKGGKKKDSMNYELMHHNISHKLWKNHTAGIWRTLLRNKIHRSEERLNSEDPKILFFYILVL